MVLFPPAYLLKVRKTQLNTLTTTITTTENISLSKVAGDVQRFRVTWDG